MRALLSFLLVTAFVPVTARADDKPSTSDAVTKVTVTQGLSKLLTFERNILKLTFANPAVIDAVPLSTRYLQVTGIRAGTSALTVFVQRDLNDKQGEPREYLVEVVAPAKMEMRFDAAFDRASALQALRFAAKAGNLQLITSGEITANVTLTLPDTTLDIMLQALCKQANLHYLIIGDTLLVSTQPLKGLDKNKPPSGSAKAEVWALYVVEIHRTALEKLAIEWLPTNSQFGTLSADPPVLEVLRPLQSRSELRILSSPMLTVARGAPARIQVGGKIPIATASPDNDRTREVRDASGNQVGIVDWGLWLELSYVAGTINVAVEESYPESDGRVSAPRISREHVSMGEREVLVARVPGLTRSLSSRLKQIPSLFKLPIIGSLFQSRSFQKGETELVIFIQRDPNSARFTDIRVTFADSVFIFYSLNRPAVVEARIISPSGKVVRSFDKVAATAGRNTLDWDGKDSNGKQLRRGVYLIELTACDAQGEVKALRSLSIK